MGKVVLVDAVNGNELTIIEHDGFVYFEAIAKHGGTTVVASSLRVNRDIAMLALRRMCLT